VHTIEQVRPDSVREDAIESVSEASILKRECIWTCQSSDGQGQAEAWYLPIRIEYTNCFGGARLHSHRADNRSLTNSSLDLQWAKWEVEWTRKYRWKKEAYDTEAKAYLTRKALDHTSGAWERLGKSQLF
jgi:hypothetical protein